MVQWQSACSDKQSKTPRQAIDYFRSACRRAVTFPAVWHHLPQDSTKLYCLVTEAHGQRRRQENSSGGQAIAWGATLLPHSPIPPLPVPPSFSSPPLPYLTLPFPSPLVPSPPLRSSWPPQIQLGGLGERCKLPQRGLGETIWYILALKSDIWWQQF